MSEIDPNHRFPLIFRLLLTFFLLFSLFMLFVFINVLTLSDEQIASRSLENQELFASIPAWTFFAGGTGLVLGFVGLSLLLAKKSMAQVFLAVAVVCVMMRDAWFIWDGRILEIASTASLLGSLSFFFIYLLQWLSSIYAGRKGWLS